MSVQPSVERTLYTLDVELSGAEPSIRRRIEVDGALPLDRFHLVLQSAMGWTQSHLHSFRDRDPFLPPRGTLTVVPRTWLPAESIEYGMEGFDESSETVAGALGIAGGSLWYEYDFGDSWIHSIEQASTRPAGAQDPEARVLGGKRRAPLEDCGGIGGWAQLLALWEGRSTGIPDIDEERAEHLEWIAAVSGFATAFDPEAFDVEAANADLALTLREDDFEARGQDYEPAADAHRAGRWMAGLDAWCRHEFGAALHRVGIDPLGAPGNPGLSAAAADAVVPYQWLIRSCAQQPLQLTATGNLSGAAVRQVLEELEWEQDFTVYGKGRTENTAVITSKLRETALGAGLVKASGRKLEPTAMGRKLAEDPEKLWQRLAERALPKRIAADRLDAALLELLLIAREKTTRAWVRRHVGTGMSMIGYVGGDGEPVGPETYFRVVEQLKGTRYILSTPSRRRQGLEILPGREAISAVEREFARTVLQA